MSPGVFVTGHVRSGTSMVAGLFAAHGVVFGHCAGPSSRVNAKGFYENRWLKDAVQRGHFTPEGWLQRIRAEGWTESSLAWGAKLMPMWWDVFRHVEPAVVVCCYRPREAILASSARVGWPRSDETVDDRWEIMARIPSETDAAVFAVDTPELVAGRYDAVTPAFEALGIEFRPEVARTWIDPSLWRF